MFRWGTKKNSTPRAFGGKLASGGRRRRRVDNGVSATRSRPVFLGWAIIGSFVPNAAPWGGQRPERRRGLPPDSNAPQRMVPPSSPSLCPSGVPPIASTPTQITQKARLTAVGRHRRLRPGLTASANKGVERAKPGTGDEARTQPWILTMWPRRRATSLNIQSCARNTCRSSTRRAGRRQHFFEQRINREILSSSAASIRDCIPSLAPHIMISRSIILVVVALAHINAVAAGTCHRDR